MSTVLNVKIDPLVKTKAHKIAEELGMSLSGVVNVYLRELIRTKTIFASTREEIPSARLIKSIHDAEEDIKAGRVESFESGAEAIEFLRRRRLTDKSN